MNRIVLQKIINYRILRIREGEHIVARGTPHEQKTKNALYLAQVVVNDDGHSNDSYKWIKTQSIEIDKYGWEKWLNSEIPKIKEAEALLHPSKPRV